MVGRVKRERNDKKQADQNEKWCGLDSGTGLGRKKEIEAQRQDQHNQH